MRLAVWLALAANPFAVAQAAEEIWPVEPPAAVVPMEQGVPSQMPVVPTFDGVPVPQLVPAESYYNMEEPIPPGEGPVSLDAEAMRGSEKLDFWKPTIHAGVTGSVVFDDNIFIRERDPESDVIFYTSARVTLAFGNVDSWAARFINTTPLALLDSQEAGGENLIALSYAPTAEFFTKNDDLNTVNHDIAGTVRWEFTKLRVAFDSRFQTLSDPEPDLGRRADRKLFNSHLQLNYDWTEKSVIEANVDYEARDYDEGQDSAEIKGDLYAILQSFPKTTFGVGLSVGQLELDGGNSQNFEQLLLRTAYNSYSKLVATLVVGAELRQIENSKDQTNAVFELSLGYEAAENTRFNLIAGRRTDASAAGNSQSIERTSISLELNQVLFQALTLTSNLSYSLAEYAEQQDSQSRTDHIFGFSANLVFQLTKYGYTRLGYTFTKNDSDLLLNSYDSNQVTLSLTALF